MPDWSMEDHARALLRALAPSLARARVALVASFQETEDAQRMVRDGMERLRAEFPEQVVIATSEVPYETHKGYARVDALSRDLAVLATSHALVVGRSQFSVLAALLQRPDGVHVTTGPKQLVDASGCHYFANTLVVGRHTDAATGATRRRAEPSAPGRLPARLASSASRSTSDRTAIPPHAHALS